MNAAPIEEAGGGLIVADAELSPAWIRDTLLPVLLDSELVAAMSAAAAGMGHADADRRLAAAVLDVMAGRGGQQASRR
jgi:UDP-N-acetylglucosamine--N-acetylmuramyl-(pentapeptide) pyrophosphoryl-undecaprenol N-acetylglucosamine transferase